MRSRLRRLPTARNAPAGLEVRVAATRRARLLGLAGLRALPAGVGLLLPSTRSVHTFGMRFALDLVWLDGVGRVVRIDETVPRRRLRSCRRARAVLEFPAGEAQRSSLAVAYACIPLTGSRTSDT